MNNAVQAAAANSEQTASAAQTLDSEANAMHRLVASFKLSAGEPGAPIGGDIDAILTHGATL